MRGARETGRACTRLEARAVGHILRACLPTITLLLGALLERLHEPLLARHVEQQAEAAEDEHDGEHQNKKHRPALVGLSRPLRRRRTLGRHLPYFCTFGSFPLRLPSDRMVVGLLVRGLIVELDPLSVVSRRRCEQCARGDEQR